MICVRLLVKTLIFIQAQKNKQIIITNLIMENYIYDLTFNTYSTSFVALYYN